MLVMMSRWRNEIEKLQENPNCVLLLDEIEKAHPDVSKYCCKLWTMVRLQDLMVKKQMHVIVSLFLQLT